VKGLSGKGHRRSKGAGSSSFNEVFNRISKESGHKKDIRSFALGVAIATGKATMEGLYAKPGIKVSLENVKDRLLTGKWEEYESWDEVNKHADKMIRFLKSRKVKINKLAVDGLPGSGKTTISRALAKKLKFKWKSLDHMNLNKPIDFSQGHTVYEHHRLLRTQDPDNFDAIVYIDFPIELAKKRILQRKRGAIIVDIWDFEKLKQIGDKAFKICNGKVHCISNNNIKIKIKPAKGFKAYKNIIAELKMQGVKTSGLSKEQLLFLSLDGKARQGLIAYTNASVYSKELLTGLLTGLQKFLR